MFLSLPSVSVSFEFKLFRHVEWLGVFRGYSYWCIRDTSVSETWVCVCVSVHVCFRQCQNKETVQWIFHSSTLPLPLAASQFWPPKHAEMHSESDKHKQTQTTHTHTHTCSVSRRSCRLRGSRLQRFRAGATTVQTHLPSGSEAVLYTCQPSSEPGYKPCTQTGSALMMSLQEQHILCAFNSGEGQQSEAKCKFCNLIVCFAFCEYSSSHFWGYWGCFYWI